MILAVFTVVITNEKGLSNSYINNPIHVIKKLIIQDLCYLVHKIRGSLSKCRVTVPDILQCCT